MAQQGIPIGMAGQSQFPFSQGMNYLPFNPYAMRTTAPQVQTAFLPNQMSFN